MTQRKKGKGKREGRAGQKREVGTQMFSDQCRVTRTALGSDTLVSTEDIISYNSLEFLSCNIQLDIGFLLVFNVKELTQ